MSILIYMTTYLMISNNSVRVLHVIDHLGLGGAQRVLSEIVSMRNDSVFVLRKKEEEINIERREITYCSTNIHYSIGNIIQLRKYIIENNIAIVHTHLAKSAIYSFLATMFLHNRIALVLHEHGEIFNKRNRLRESLYKLFLLLSVRSISRYVAVSNTSALELTKYVNKQKVKIIYNPVNIKEFRSNAYKDFTGIRKVGFAGRLYEGKGWRQFLDLAEAFANIQFYIAGVGPDKKVIKNEIVSRKLRNVRLLGFVQDMSNFYFDIDVYVSCSLSESFGLTVVESIASGTPVIATDIPAHRELLANEKVGYLYKVGDLNTLKQCLRMLNNRKRYLRVQREGLLYSKRFSKDKFLLSLAKLYANVVKYG